ncbi:hypothetical protein KUTeg_006908 [Tegillarca granosa]|uniref:Glucosylceramidase n=1 Tax=Tegillarca granosa TaxID=220873 RepID=A0ABQ9FGF3_TEGGR|nr:hypothetical protein KUTeg_006908 [Tegillarca granosa]
MLLRLFLIASVLFQSVLLKKVQVYLTTGDQSKKLSQEADLYPSNSNGRQIHIDRYRRYQTMEGFGAAMTNSAAFVIYHSSKRQEIMQHLFSNTSGIVISYIRLTMGGSDFMAVPPYTYDDLPQGVNNDFNMDYFDISKDRAFVIPMLKQARSINPNLKIIATPWSAPSWMKTTNSLYGGDFRGESQYQQAYSKYFVKFIQAYKSEGVEINAITIQNEPLNNQNGYPTMYMSSQIQRDLIKYHLGPEFRKNNINTKIIIYDHNWDHPEYPGDILNDQTAAQYVSGVGWHCYGGDATEPGNFHASHPNIDIYHTECSGGDWANNFSDNLVWNMDNLFIQQPHNWAKTVLLWNLALNENHGPQVQVGGCHGCRGVLTVHSGSGQYESEVEYYVIGHLSKVVQPGAVRIESTDKVGDFRSVAFQHKDGTIAIIVLNKASHSNSFSLNIDGSHYNYNLPAKSVASFLYSY